VYAAGVLTVSHLMKIRSFLGLIASLLIGCMAAQAEGAQGAHWFTNFEEAVQQAKSTHHNILINFTGSDWCPVCKIMDKEVLDTPQFEKYADGNLVLMMADFPQTKPLPAPLADQNAKLQAAYGVEDFPSFILVDKSGNVLGRQTGMVEGGAAAFIKKIESFEK
jgi:thioredoxin-related protein